MSSTFSFDACHISKWFHIPSDKPIKLISDNIKERIFFLRIHTFTESGLFQYVIVLLYKVCTSCLDVWFTAHIHSNRQTHTQTDSAIHLKIICDTVLLFIIHITLATFWRMFRTTSWIQKQIGKNLSPICRQWSHLEYARKKPCKH